MADANTVQTGLVTPNIVTTTLTKSSYYPNQEADMEAIMVIQISSLIILMSTM